MGFSLIFVRLDGDDGADADRDGLRRFLAARGLRAPTGPGVGELTGVDGELLAFDGRWTDLHLDPLDKSEPLSGGIWHASLSPQECDFVFDLCVAAGWLIVNPQGDPEILVPGGTHTPEQLPSYLAEAGETAVYVGSGAELRQALTSDFTAFLAYRDQVLDESRRGTGRAAP